MTNELNGRRLGWTWLRRLTLQLARQLTLTYVQP